MPSDNTAKLGQQFSGWLTTVGTNISHFISSNLLGFLVGGVVLYLVYAPDFTSVAGRV
jgi:hypothetical protein